MIVYTASYPRSGNSWVRSVIIHRLGHIPSSVHKGGWDLQVKHYPEWGMVKATERSAPDPEIAGLPPERFGYFTSPTLPGNPTIRMVMSGCKDFLVDETRRRLAEHDTVYFIKTHFPPFSSYFEREFVIQPVRHAGAAIWSYYHFLNANGQNNVSLDQVIEGSCLHGSWSEYLRNWNAAKETLGDRLLRIRYEDLFDAEQMESFVALMGRITGVAPLDAAVPSFDKLRAERPNHFRKGDANEWRSGLSAEQLNKLWSLHGPELAAAEFN